MNLQRLTAIAGKEFIHVMRDWRSLYLSLAIPVILIMLFGYALTLDLRNVPTVVFDQSRTAQSRELLSLYEGSPYFSMVGYYDDYASVQLALERGDDLLAIRVVMPSDFAQKINTRKSMAVQILGDGSDANTSRLAMAAVFLTGAFFWGMFLSIVLKSQVLANQIALVSGYLPTLILSGFVFAIVNMPLPIQVIAYIVPGR